MSQKLNVEQEYAQLLELERLVRRNGHDRLAIDPESCEVCRNLIDLRKVTTRADRIELMLVLKRLRQT